MSPRPIEGTPWCLLSYLIHCAPICCALALVKSCGPSMSQSIKYNGIQSLLSRLESGLITRTLHSHTFVLRFIPRPVSAVGSPRFNIQISFSAMLRSLRSRFSDGKSAHGSGDADPKKDGEVVTDLSSARTQDPCFSILHPPCFPT